MERFAHPELEPLPLRGLDGLCLRAEVRGWKVLLQLVDAEGIPADSDPFVELPRRVLILQRGLQTIHVYETVAGEADLDRLADSLCDELQLTPQR